MDRMACNVVPIPGESEWVTKAWKELEAKSGNALAVSTPASASSSASPSASSAKKKKRTLESSAEDENMTDEAAPPAAAVAAGEDAAATPVKKGKSEAATAVDAAGTDAAARGASLPADRGLEVIVTVYDTLARAPQPATPADASSVTAATAGSTSATSHRLPVRVGDLYEFIGVLSITPDLKASMESEDAFNDNMGLGDELWGPRRRQALRMHALTAVKVEPGFPFIADPTTETALFEKQRSELLPVLPTIRASLLTYFTSLLGGDALAAQVLLLFLVQRLHSRGSVHSGRSLLGKLVVNFITPSSPDDNPQAAVLFGKRISEALKNIMPRVTALEVNIQSLNAQVWHPKKSQSHTHAYFSRWCCVDTFSTHSCDCLFVCCLFLLFI
jgi:hypothetical protein